MKRFLSLFLLFSLFVLPFSAFPSIDNSSVTKAYHNEVVIYSEYIPGWQGSRGAGTVYYIDETSTYIITCLHLRDAGPSRPVAYDVYFANGVMKQGDVIFDFSNADGEDEDMMIIRVPGFQWDSYSKLAPTYMGEKIFGFNWEAIEDPMTHRYTNFYDRKLTTRTNEGIVDSEPQPEPMGIYERGMPFRIFYMEDMTVETHSGMSGSGIFNQEGNLVGLVNGCCDMFGNAAFSPILAEIEHYNLDPFGWAFCPWIPRLSK